MVTKTPNLFDHADATSVAKPLDPLLPDRHPQHDLFICDVADAVLKDMMAHMEHPFYSLSKKPETNIRRYEHNGNWIEITPSVKGLATIYDKDILIYCISQIMAKLKDGQPVSPRVRINTRDLLVFTNRGTAGKDYAALAEALARLAGTRISTNIQTADEEQYDTFGLIDTASIRRKHGLDGRLLWCEVKLSEWVFNAIRSHEVLTLHRDYFRLRKPIERRVYEIARKHCGSQKEWKVGVPTLLKKTGSQSPLKRFREMIRDLVAFDHLPDYSVSFEAETDMVTFLNRGTMTSEAIEMPPALFTPLDPETFAKVKEVAPGWDVYHLEQEWRAWMMDGGLDAPANPDKAFLGFCRKFFEKRGRP
ncbi:plasmid replication initiator (plasmid) [Pacificitalea manganoxidans]|uniref:Plasmid replication initiator n=1 Tax=Pacificitalea manganoxidans TaxID=1411902 RepID=A0A291M501_9RHOB|nr:replication initiator protein A [Pacificitalea manganoxidans]ATI44053.1 plasmid replication initiator [Pacificitalea manganoxidans]MDR6310375.1 plasmid replication initiation protein [Pacificitalea manganoxidans]